MEMGSVAGSLVARFDGWLTPDSDVAALVMREWLEPVDGPDGVIFPPTYARREGVRDDDWLGYNIDHLPDGSNVCLIDSVGSQANRMEPIFKREPYRNLVPQVVVRADVPGGERRINLLEAGHRAADALVRFSTLGPELHGAYLAMRDRGDAEPLARVAPTSIVFGSWDSRATQVKVPRIVRSVIRAYNVQVLHRSAQYSTVAGEVLGGGEADVEISGPRADLGLAHVPATWTHGGVRVLGEIRRDTSINLEALRAMAPEASDNAALRLLRYLLGLSLVAITVRTGTTLREGCQLVPVADRAAEWQLVRHDGRREAFQVDPAGALEYAAAAASEFGVEDRGQAYDFRADLAQAILALDDKERQRLLRSGPVTPEALEGVRRGQGRRRRGQDAAVEGPRDS